MGSSSRFFEGIFSKISGLTKYDLSNHILVNNSPNTVIRDNIIEQPIILLNEGFAEKDETYSLGKKVGVRFDRKTVDDKTDRAMLNIDYIDKFIFACNKQNIIPTVRMYAFFSHISSIRLRSDTSDYNQLVLSEKDLFDKMIYLNFRIKLIISLEVGVILEKWYDNISDIIARMTDLSDRIDETSDRRNVEVVIDDGNYLDGQFILHDCLFIHALKSDPILKYSMTEYETRPALVKNAIRVFDQRFAFLKASNTLVRSHLRIGTMGEFVKRTVDGRIEEISNTMATK
ncbi:MAG: hypothetical protein LUF30_03405 [Lachnospiraceae bacterium]|nr:hypothetical protein [Lachnospiraceae bacterium]